MPKAEIRRLTIEDYDAMTQVWKRAGLPYKPQGRDSRQNTAKQMEQFPEFYLGAFHGNKLLGVVIASYESRMKGWINRLAVDPEYQRQGVAEQLVRKAEKALKKHGAKIFCALIELPNDKSVGLFQKMGYALYKDILYVTKRDSKDV
jgi:ribosomal protein S18 acetylase RimI-like enzyme